jgi:hypothetical protein
MKKKIRLLSIPFVLLAAFLSLGFLPFLLLPIIILFVNYLVDRKESNPVVQEMKGRLFHSVEEVELKYGKPDSVVVLNAAKANEISDVVLSYPERGILVMAGREIPMDDITSIAPKNMAIIPYVVDEYAVVINTKNPAEPVIYLRVGYDMGYAQEVAMQIHEILRSSAAPNMK